MFSKNCFESMQKELKELTAIKKESKQCKVKCKDCKCLPTKKER